VFRVVLWFCFICLFYQGRQRFAAGKTGIPRASSVGNLVEATVLAAGDRAAYGRGTGEGHGSSVEQSLVERWKAAAVGGRVCQLLVGQGPERLCPAAQGRRRGVRLDCRKVGQRAGDRVRRVRRPPGGRRSGECGGQQRCP